MIKHGLIHWKTTVFGIAAAAAHVIANGRSGKEVVTAVVFAVIGYLMPDPDKLVTK